MREVLYRAKRVVNNEWIEGFYVKTPIGEAFMFTRRQEKNGVYKVIPETRGEFTGLTDKNGTKIFEGDIISAIDKNDISPEEKKYTVCFDQERNGYFPFAHGDGCGCCETDTIYPAHHEITVLGNIHDNSELVGGDK